MPRFNRGVSSANRKRREGMLDEESISECVVPTASRSTSPAKLKVVTRDAEEDDEPLPRRILIAGASGAVGFPCLRLCKESGFRVRTLSRNRLHAPKVSLFSDEIWLRDATVRESIRGVCQGTDIVLSCMGASLDLRETDKRGFSHVDFEANRNLLQEAVEANVSRFVYVSVYGEQPYERTAYVRAHRRFEEALCKSGLNYSIIRLTGLHSTLSAMTTMVRSGAVPIVGRGGARTNPIHPEDAAELCLRYLMDGPEIVEAGGPEVLTRREISELVFGFLGETPNFYQLPRLLLRIASSLTRPFNPRKAGLLEFLPAVSRADAIAPQVGTRSLAEYLLEQDGLFARSANWA